MPFHDDATDWIKEALRKARAGVASDPIRSLPPPSVRVTTPSYRAPSQVAEVFRRRTGRDPAPPRFPTTPYVPSAPPPIAPFLQHRGVSATRALGPPTVVPSVPPPTPTGLASLISGFQQRPAFNWQQSLEAVPPRERLAAWGDVFFGEGRPTEDSYPGVGPGAAPVPIPDVIEAFETAPETYGPVVGGAIKMAPRIAVAAPMALIPGGKGIKPAIGALAVPGGAFAMAEPISDFLNKGIDANLDRITDHLKGVFDIEDTTPDQEAALKAYAGTEQESPAYQEYMAERGKRQLREKFAEAWDQVTTPDMTKGEKAVRNWSFVRHLTPGVLKGLLYGIAAPWDKGVAAHVGAGLYVAEINQKDSLERQIIEKGVDETKANRARGWLAATGTMPIGYETVPMNKWDYSSIGTGEALEKGEEQYRDMPMLGQIALIFAGNKWDPLYGITLANKANRAVKYGREMATRWLEPVNISVDAAEAALKTGEGFLEPGTIKAIRGLKIPGFKQAATLLPESRAALASQETSTFLINLRNRAGSGEEAHELFAALVQKEIPELAENATKVLRSFGLGRRKANAFEATLSPDITQGVTAVDELGSRAALLARAVSRNILKGPREVKKIVNLIDEAANFSGTASRETRTAAGEKLVNLIADSAHSVAGGDPTKLQKFLKPWSKVQGFAARYLHLGLVPGFGFRNFATDQYVLWSEHGKTVLGDTLFVEGKKGAKNVVHTFDEYWGEMLEPVRSLGFRDFDNLDKAASNPAKWELGYRVSKWSERLAGKMASAIPIKRQMNQHFHSGAAFEDIFGEITDLAPETIAALRRIMKQASNPRQLQKLFAELRGGTLGTEIVGNHAKPLAENGLLTKVSKILERTKGNPALLQKEVNVLEEALWRKTEPQSVIKGLPFESGTYYEEFHHGTREMLDNLGIDPTEAATIEREAIATAKQWRRYMDTAVARAYRTIDELPDNLQSQYMQRADEISKAYHAAINTAETGVLAVGRALRRQIKREGGGQQWGAYDYHNRINKLWQDVMRIREDAFDALRRDAEKQVGRRVTADAPQRITTVMPDIPFPRPHPHFPVKSGTLTRDMIETGEELGRLRPEFPSEIRGIPDYVSRIETPPMPDDVAAMRIPEAVQTLRNWLDDQLDANLFEEFEGVTKGQGKAFIKATRKLLNRHVEGRTIFEAVARQERDYLLHNYGRKYNLDTLLGAAYGYHFWYTRTFAKWAGKTFTNPNAIGASLRFMNSIADANEEKPIWDRTTATVENIFGRNEIATNFMAQVLPLALMLEGQFTNANRVKSMFGEVYENMYGNLGPHIAMNPIIAYALRQAGRFAEASAYGGYMGTTDRTFTSLTAQLALSGVENVGPIPVPPGGTHPLHYVPFGQEIYPELWGRGYDGSTRFYGPLYEHKRMGTELGLMVEEKLISDVVAADALRVSTDSSAFIGEPAMQPAYAAIDVALQRMRTKDFVPNMTSYLTGPRVHVKGEAQLASEEHITALHEEAGQLFSKLADPMYPEDELRAEFREFQAKHPDHVIMQGFRKHGEERIRAYNFTVLSRVEPGRRGRDKLKAAGLDYDLVQEFWDNGGRIPSGIDATKFQAGIDALGMILALPTLFEVTEWTEASTRRGNLIESLQKKYGEEIEEIKDDYHNLRNMPGGDTSGLLARYPELKAYLDEEATAIAVDPLMAPYYASYETVKAAMRATFWNKWEGQLPGSPEAYQYYLENKNGNNWPAAMRTAYLEQHNLTELNKEYNESMTRDPLDERVRAFGAQVITAAKHARVRRDAPVDTGGVTVQAVRQEALEAGPLIRQLESDQTTPGGIASAVGTAPKPTTVPVTTDPRLLLQTEQAGTASQALLGHEQWEKNYLEEAQKKLTYMDTLKPDFDMGFGQFIEDLGADQATWNQYEETSLFERFPYSALGVPGIVAYVQQNGGGSIREAMMTETMGGNFTRDLAAWRVLGTIQKLRPEQLDQLKLQYPELIDINNVYWTLYGEAEPTLGLLLKSMGLNGGVSIDGEAYTSKITGIKALTPEQVFKTEDLFGSLVIDEDNKFLDTGDVHEVVRRVADRYIEKGIEVQYERWRALGTALQYEQQDALYESNPNIEKFALLKKMIFANFNASSLIPGSDKWVKFRKEMDSTLKTGGIEAMLKLIDDKSLRAVKGLVKDVKKAARTTRTPRTGRSAGRVKRSILHDFHSLRTRSIDATQRRQAQQRQAPQAQDTPSIAPWLSIYDKWTQDKNPMLVMLMDYFDLSAYARQSHLQRNPDLARWLATIPAAQLVAIERAYYIWAKQRGRISPRQEQRVSRSRPALANVLRVYQPRSTRAGI